MAGTAFLVPALEQRPPRRRTQQTLRCAYEP